MRRDIRFGRRHVLVPVAALVALGGLGGLGAGVASSGAQPQQTGALPGPGPAAPTATATVGSSPAGHTSSPVVAAPAATTSGAGNPTPIKPAAKAVATANASVTDLAVATAGPAATTTKAPTVAAATPTGASTSRSVGSATAGYTGSWGVYAPDFPGTLATVDALQSEVHRTATYVMWYVHWAGPYSGLDLANLAAVKANGSTPMITWMSDDPTGVTTITDAAVAAGKYDGYIRSWAQGLRSYRRPVLLRFDHEMNGNWSGWSPGVNGNTPASYIAAWRHVYSIFSSAGASNVTFVWSPNVDYTGATPMSSVYPGNSYVGMVGLDGYNWGTVEGHVWQTPQQVFGPSVAEITAVTSRPLMITEVGSTSAGGDKPGWIGQLFQYLRSTPAIRGFVWFDANKETDWSIGSVPGSLSAFVTGMTG